MDIKIGPVLKLKIRFMGAVSALGLEAERVEIRDREVGPGVYVGFKMASGSARGFADRLKNPEQDVPKLKQAGIPYVEVK